MSVTPVDLLNCADAVCAGDEAHRRTTAGRSYYAAYHDSCSWQQGGHSPDQPKNKDGSLVRGMHRAFIEGLIAPHMSNPVEWRRKSTQRGVLLRALHAIRVEADYELSGDFSAERACKAIVDARAIMAIG